MPFHSAKIAIRKHIHNLANFLKNLFVLATCFAQIIHVSGLKFTGENVLLCYSNYSLSIYKIGH